MATQNNVNNDCKVIASSAVTIDPGAAGDSYTQFDINTTGEFRIGVDDTDDSFRISQGSALGTNDTFVMSELGARTMPLQPAFFAYLGSTVNNVTGGGAYWRLGTTTALTEVFDQGGDFNTNGTFTAPRTGRYLLCGAIKMGDITAAMTNDRIVFESSNRNYFLNSINGAVLRDASNVFSFKGEVIADMDAADTVYFKINMAEGAGNTADAIGQATHPVTYFCGCLIT